jgi:hypothetical protein
MVATLDRCWRLMSGARSPLRTALMLLPPAIGIVLAVALRDRAEIGALLSAAALASVLGGALLRVVLTLVYKLANHGRAGSGFEPHG